MSNIILKPYQHVPHQPSWQHDNMCDSDGPHVPVTDITNISNSPLGPGEMIHVAETNTMLMSAIK